MIEERVEVVLGTRNQGKIAEFRPLLKGMPIQLRSFLDLPAMPRVREDGKTFKENAEKKARIIAKATNKISIAEDSGLEVEYLGGAPGVRSARFAGEHASDRDNIRKLLKLLDGVSWQERSARFVCVVCVSTPSGETICAEGVCRGRIGFEMRGRHGFGYDPVFVPQGHSMTMAEMDPALKNTISHRADAMNRFRDVLRKFIEARSIGG